MEHEFTHPNFSVATDQESRDRRAKSAGNITSDFRGEDIAPYKF